MPETTPVETAAILETCTKLTDPDSDIAISRLTVTLVEAALPETAVAVFIDSDVCAERTTRFDEPVAIVPIECSNYCFGRIEVFTTRREIDERDLRTVEAISQLTSSAIRLRRLLNARKEHTRLTYEIHALREESRAERQRLLRALDIHRTQSEATAVAIHETVLQDLAAILLGLRDIETNPDEKMAARLHAALADTIASLKLLTAKLAPLPVESLGLVSALGSLPQVISGETELVSEVEPLLLSPNVEVACFQVVDELISDTTSSSIVLSDAADGFEMTVTTPDRFHLETDRWNRMRDQCAVVGANLRVRSQPSEPLRFTVQMPSETAQAQPFRDQAQTQS